MTVDKIYSCFVLGEFRPKLFRTKAICTQVVSYHVSKSFRTTTQVDSYQRVNYSIDDY